MDISATFLGQFVAVSAVIIGILSYYLGRRKTTNPVIAGILGFLIGLIPVLGLIFVAVLLFKPDVKDEDDPAL
ncbi:hypothetical protein ACR0ST_06940 [Aliidiomarina sp. Khilg15.8]